MTTEELVQLAEKQIVEEDEERHEEMSDGLSGAVGARLTTYLNLYVWEHNLGTVFNADTDFVLPGIGKRRPDIAYCSFETLPELPRTVLPVLPDLAVEVTSSRDEIDDTDKKLKEYQQVKIKLVWVIRPVVQVVEVYKAGKATDLLGIDDTIEGDPVLPGFKLAVRKLFELSSKPKSEL